MPNVIKDYLSPQWWAVADCADAYESECGNSFPELRSYVERLTPADRPAGLAELVKIEMERRWRSGTRKKVEDYLRDYSELSDPSVSLSELVVHEALIRARHGDPPSLDELHNRFPTLDANKLLPPGQELIGTIALGGPNIETERSDSRADEPAVRGTIVFDTEQSNRSSGSTAGGGSSPTAGGAARVPQAAAATGSISRYAIRQQLGSGSFGVVLRCFDEDLKRDVAIKLPHRQGASSAERVKEFLHEAQSAARLRHPGIVTVLDTGQSEDGRVYIVYEFIRGETLQRRLEAGNYSLEDIVGWVADTAEALHHAHKNGIVHRDIKPANILLDEESRPHVADFGLAKMDDHFFKDDAGRVLGTAAYMSPEQAAGQSHWASPQTDIYSLGVMLYQMLTRRLPFNGGTLSELLEQVKHRVPSPPRTIDDKTPKPLEDICLKAMAKNPADRYSTAADMAADLRKALAGAPPARWGRWWAGGLAGAAAAAGVALMLIWGPGHNDSTRSLDGSHGVAPGGSGQAGTNGAEQSSPFSPGTPKLDIDYQAATEAGVWHPLGGKPLILHEGDKVQFHVKLDVPRYVYLYWYDVNGKPERLWPVDADHQSPVMKVDSPEAADDWRGIDSQRGAEFVMVAARDEPLLGAELSRFERQSAYPKNAVRLSDFYQVGSKELSRGLGAVVKSRKDPLDIAFEKTLHSTFASFHGLVIPHL
ncbi:MAG TPA: protein kinase [Pirellulales bacterium]|jgi:hypothetical protein|nr:protein kinase [Pirellulales bacterium]